MPKKETFQIEPAIPPHQPNFEYDVIARNQRAGGEAFGAAAVANAALYREPLITSWETMSDGASGSFNYIRGFDMVTCVKPAEYHAIADSLDRTLTWIGTGLLIQNFYLKHYRVINIILALTLGECIWSMLK